MATPRTNPTKDQIQYLFNQQVDDAVSPAALVFGIKGIDATSGGYTAFTGNVLGAHFALDVKIVDASGNQVTSFNSNITSIGHGVKTVTTAGTDEALAGSTACKRVIIQSQTDNTGLIAVGASGVDATEATGTGIILYAGDALELEIDNLADVYIDATVSGEGVRYVWFS